jgi:hypothetical protein
LSSCTSFASLVFVSDIVSSLGPGPFSLLILCCPKFSTPAKGNETRTAGCNRRGRALFLDRIRLRGSPVGELPCRSPTPVPRCRRRLLPLRAARLYRLPPRVGHAHDGMRDPALRECRFLPRVRAPRRREEFAGILQWKDPGSEVPTRTRTRETTLVRDSVGMIAQHHVTSAPAGSTTSVVSRPRRDPAMRPSPGSACATSPSLAPQRRRRGRTTPAHDPWEA